MTDWGSTEEENNQLGKNLVGADSCGIGNGSQGSVSNTSVSNLVFKRSCWVEAAGCSYLELRCRVWAPDGNMEVLILTNWLAYLQPALHQCRGGAESLWWLKSPHWIHTSTLTMGLCQVTVSGIYLILSESSLFEAIVLYSVRHLYINEHLWKEKVSVKGKSAVLQGSEEVRTGEDQRVNVITSKAGTGMCIVPESGFPSLYTTLNCRCSHSGSTGKTCSAGTLPAIWLKRANQRCGSGWGQETGHLLFPIKQSDMASFL